MIYTGLTIDELNQATETDPSIKAIVDMAHYLKTGPYVEALRDTTLRWRGSTNQTLWTQTPEGWGRIED
jgi:hypothetical protein